MLTKHKYAYDVDADMWESSGIRYMNRDWVCGMKVKLTSPSARASSIYAEIVNFVIFEVAVSLSLCSFVCYVVVCLCCAMCCVLLLTLLEKVRFRLTFVFTSNTHTADTVASTRRCLGLAGTKGT